MKILYITPRIIGEGGLVRVIAMKANYFVNYFGYEVHILTQNNNHINPFYSFNDKIKMHTMQLKGNRLLFLKNYIFNVKSVIQKTNPDIIIVCDGLKGFFLPYFLENKIPIVFESHGSIFNSESKPKYSFLLCTIQTRFKRIAAAKFTKFIVLSKESEKEWNVANSVIIPNPIWFKLNELSSLSNNKIIAIARHSYEKGLDRLIEVWKNLEKKYPDWTLHIYGSKNTDLYLNLANKDKLTNIHFHEPTSFIKQKYLESSILLMTSRFEGFPMSLLEAMGFGLPCVAFDCPIGPKAIITNNENGFLIEDGNTSFFSDKVSELIENSDLRNQIGKNAAKEIQKYDLDEIMKKWNDFLKTLIR